MSAISKEAEARTGLLVVYVMDDPIDDASVASVKRSIPDAIVLANLLDPLYDPSISTREAAQKLGRVKAELEAMVENGVQVVVLCERRAGDLGTRSHFLASLCAPADHVHFRSKT